MAPLMWLLIGLSVGAPSGWRGDGSGRYPDAHPPASWSSSENLAWRTPTETWGNASPVLFGELVCVTEEPTTVLCLDAHSGELRWRAHSDYVHSLTVDARADFEARVTEAARAERSLHTLQSEYSQLQRDVRRRTAPPEARDRLPELSAEIDRLAEQVGALAPYLTDDDRGIIGYASATPVTDGEYLYALFGNGVVSRFDPQGQRSWSVWMGPPPAQMRGYHMGTSASPVLADGTLIVGFGSLRGLDPETGAVRWTHADYPHYGTPAVAQIGERTLVITPDGEGLDANDGRVLIRDLGSVFYVGPYVFDDIVYFLGGPPEGEMSAGRSVEISSWRLSPTADGVQAEARWRREIPARRAFFTAPVQHGEYLFWVSRKGELRVLSATTGEVLHEADLAGSLGGDDVYPSPTIAGDRLWIGGGLGVTVAIELTPPFAIQSESRLGRTRSTPILRDDRVWFRTLDAVYGLQAP